MHRRLYLRQKEEFNPDIINIQTKEIAVVGATNKEHKYGYKIFSGLIKHGFKAKAINPKNGTVLGQKIYKNLRDLERIPDLVITVVPPRITERIVQECSQMGIREIWMQPGSESEEAVKKAKEYRIRVNSGRCFMTEHNLW